MRNGLGLRRLVGLLSALVVVASCGADEPSSDAGPSRSASPTPTPSEQLMDTEPPSVDTSRPDWLGTRVLPERPDGLGEVQDTPSELVDRRFPPPDAQPVEDTFAATIGPVPDGVAARSTWESECPVALADLRYLTMTFWGFDERSYTGEMIVHRSVAEEVVSTFQRLYDARFPIEEMRVVARAELDAPPTGDGNNTTAFVCRPTTLRQSWSQHAYGLAVDVNPFHNPYRRGDAVVPELASAYLDRGRDLPGMIQPGDMVTAAFADLGWGWGGDWTSLDDWMHFSQSGR